MTDNDFVNADGSRSASGKSDPVAQRWADMMTEQYDALAQQHAIFGDLRNVMDLTVVSALIISEGLEGKSGCALDLIAGRSGNVQPAQYSVPRHVDTQCSFVKRQRGGWIVSASGGIAIDYVAPLSRKQQKDSLSVKTAAIPADTTRWWWNG